MENNEAPAPEVVETAPEVVEAPVEAPVETTPVEDVAPEAPVEAPVETPVEAPAPAPATAVSLEDQVYALYDQGANFYSIAKTIFGSEADDIVARVAQIVDDVQAERYGDVE